MAWTSSFNQDTDTEGLGTLTIIYTDNDNNIISYSGRCDTNDIDALTELCNKVKSTIENKLVGDSKKTDIINKILNEVNKVQIATLEEAIAAEVIKGGK